MGEFWEFLGTPVARAVTLSTIAVILALVGWYGVSVWRDRVSKTETTHDHLTNFRELHQRGVLADHEFRTIKTVLCERLQGELKQDGENS